MNERLRVAATATAILTIMTLLAVPATFDDLGGLRPQAGYDEFWATTNHPAVSVDAAVSSSGDLDSRTVARAESGLPCAFDDWWCTFGVSVETTVDSRASGAMIIIR